MKPWPQEITIQVAPAPVASTPETSPEQRAEIHRKLGRCMLRLQQYERLTKTILVDHELSGTVDTLQARRQARIDEFKTLTLGQLIKQMQASYLVPNAEGESRVAAEPPPELTQVWMSFRSSMQLDPATLATTVQAMQELVELRNGLVHHLLEQFSLWTLDGCAAASAHLDQSYDRIDRHMVELVAWAKTMEETTRCHAGFMQSDAFLDVLLSKDDSAIPPLNCESLIVVHLKQAERVLAIDGWTWLNDAIAHISKCAKGEVPSRYQCKTWRQVLQRSGVFEFERRQSPGQHGLLTAYRTLP